MNDFGAALRTDFFIYLFFFIFLGFVCVCFFLFFFRKTAKLLLLCKINRC